MRVLWDGRLNVVTPCFLGGADQNAEPRAAALRGALRYWFRVLAGGAYKTALEMRSAEAELFGDGTHRSMASSVLVRMWGRAPAGRAETAPPNSAPAELKTSSTPRWVNPIAYLGHGPYVFKEQRTQAARSFFAPGQSLSVRILDRRGLSNDRRRQLFLALWGLSTLGGLGQRARNGLGSFTLADRSVFSAELGEHFVPEMPSKEAFASLVRWSKPEAPRFAVWSSQSRVVRLREHTTVTEALAELGSATIEARAVISPKEARSPLGLPITRGPQGRLASPIHKRVVEVAPDRYCPLFAAIPYESGQGAALETVQRYMDALPSCTPIFP